MSTNMLTEKYRPHIEFPLICEHEGNPYKWVPLRPSDGILNIPVIEEGVAYLFTCEGKCYDVLSFDCGTTVHRLSTLPYTHWFTKPLNPFRCIHVIDRDVPMENGVYYLVRSREQWKLISNLTLIGTMPPVSRWYDERDIFPIV